MPSNSTDQADGDANPIATALSASRVYGLYEALESRTSAVVDASRAVLTGSSLYRWLTAEPDPAVVVIDLRETRTVGPLIGLLDATIERLHPYWEGSRLKRVLDTGIEHLERAAETRVGQALAAVLAPPEPPEPPADAAPDETAEPAPETHPDDLDEPEEEETA